MASGLFFWKLSTASGDRDCAKGKRLWNQQWGQACSRAEGELDQKAKPRVSVSGWGRTSVFSHLLLAVGALDSPQSHFYPGILYSSQNTMSKGHHAVNIQQGGPLWCLATCSGYGQERLRNKVTSAAS